MNNETIQWSSVALGASAALLGMLLVTFFAGSPEDAERRMSEVRIETYKAERAAEVAVIQEIGKAVRENPEYLAFLKCYAEDDEAAAKLKELEDMAEQAKEDL